MIVSPLPATPRTPGLTAANLIFIAALTLTLVLSIVEAVIFDKDQNTVRTTLITEVLGILAPALILVMVRGHDWRTTFSFNPLPFRLLWRAALLGFLAQFSVFFIASLNQWAFDIFGPFPALFKPPTQILPALGFFLLLAFVPAFCEEMLNRGVVLAGYRRIGFMRTVILVGVLFGIFHLYPSRFGYTAVLGAMLAYIVLLSRSIFASIIAHFCFNLTSGLLYLAFLVTGDVPEQQRYEYIDPKVFLPQLVISLIAATLVYLVLRSFTHHAALLRPGIVIGRYGLTKEIVEEAQWLKPDMPPIAAEPPPYVSPVYSSLPLNSPPYPAMPAPQPAWQPIHPYSVTRQKWFTGSFAAVLIFWAIFGVAQEIYIRLYYKDPQHQKSAPTAPAPQSSAPHLILSTGECCINPSPLSPLPCAGEG